MVSIHDEELLQLYLDRELGLLAARELEARVSREPALAARLESLTVAREARLRAFDAGEMPASASAAGLDQLLLSLRAARASELIAASRGPVLHREESAESDAELADPAVQPSFWTRPRRIRFWGAAAACLLVGLLVGVEADRRPSAGPSGPIGSLDTASLAGFGLGTPEPLATPSLRSPDVAVTNVDNSSNGRASNVNPPLSSLDVAVRVVRSDGKTFVFRFPDEDSADAWMRSMYDRLAREKLESKFDFEVMPTWY